MILNDSLFASGSKPGYMYGLRKIHKENTPLRPIISSIGTFSYNLAKFLVKLLSSLIKNEFSILNSCTFVKELCSVNFGYDVVMASFDITSLFTNIPLDETINLIIDNISDEQISLYGLDRINLRKLLFLATRDNVFTFNGKLYRQMDGVAMGSPLGPVLADIFMNISEKLWLSECPINFKPLYYKRYVDDTFLVFRHENQIQQFLDYLNSKHPNIKFTCEIEENSQISFLDVLITRHAGVFSTSVYRNPLSLDKA